MPWELIEKNGEKVYKYDLPEGKIYYIPKKEFDLVERICNHWEAILSERMDEETKTYLTNHSPTFNGKRFPPIDTKFYSHTERDGKHYVIMLFPNIDSVQKIPVPYPLTHNFLIQPYKNENNEKIIFFGALEKQANKKNYMMHNTAKFKFKKGFVWLPSTIRNNEVYYHETYSAFQIVAKNKDGIIIKKTFWKKTDPYSGKVLAPTADITSFLLQENVLPDVISTRVKCLFPQPTLKIGPFLIKTEQNIKEIPPLPHVIHEYKSTSYRLLKKVKNLSYPSKRRTLMHYFLGGNLWRYFFYHIPLFLRNPKKDKISDKTLLVYLNNSDEVVYQSAATNGQEVVLENSNTKHLIRIIKEGAENEIYNAEIRQSIVTTVVQAGHLPEISLAERAKAAQECCEQVNKLLHEEGHLGVDIKPFNFAHGSHPHYPHQQNFIIDDGGIIKKGTRFDLMTPYYASPELKKRNKPTVQSDIFSMGMTIEEIFNYKQDDLTKKLCQEMQCENPQWRLPLPTVHNLLNAYLVDEKSKLVDFTLDCFIHFKKELTSASYWKNKDLRRKKYHLKLENLGRLLKNLSEIKLDRPLSHFEKQTFIQLIHRMPTYTEWNTPDNIKKLLDPKIGPLLTCNLLGSFDYLEKNTNYLTFGKKETRKFIKKLFIIDVSANNALTDAIDVLKKRSLETKINSRAETIKRYEVTHQVLLEKEQDSTQEMFIHKMHQFFPECWKDKETIQHISSKNSVTHSILLRAIKYMEETQKGGHSKGRIAVGNFVKSVIELELKELKKSPQSEQQSSNQEANKEETLEEKIIKERNAFLSEKTRQYKCSYLWGVSGASINVAYPSKRREIFVPTPTARH
jgi:hypothetical protein